MSITDEFYHELRAHLEAFHHQEPLPKLTVTMTGIPREGLTVRYHHPSEDPPDPAEVVSDAAKIIGAAGVGIAGGAAVGAVIGKVVLGGALYRIGVASAGSAIGLPFLAPVALMGGAVATAAVVAYKLGRGKRDHELAENLLERIKAHLEGFKPSCGWPSIEMHVSLPSQGLLAVWQPEFKNEGRSVTTQ